MLERRILGEVPAKPHTLFTPQRSTSPGYEYVVTRDGFSGGFSLLYQSEAPTGITSIKPTLSSSDRILGVFEGPSADGPLARRHVQGWLAPKGSHLLDSRTALFQTSQRSSRMSVIRGNLDSDYAFSNGDADELYFIYDGSGELWSSYGVLAVKKHDYILIPRGTVYRFDGLRDADVFLIEGDPQIEIPPDFRNPHGQLKLEAPYTHRDFRSPHRLLTMQEQKSFQRQVVLRNNAFTEHIYEGQPCSVVGWDGSVYPMAFNINDYLPKTGKIHLPPNMHLTFRSSRFVVCSFVPRMVDYGEGAIPCPYPHANVHCDEVIYYVSGNFTSRKGVMPRSLSYHPIGLPHGPQPGNYFASVGHKKTDELAVMVDLWDPLCMSRAAKGAEDEAYRLSWV